MDKKILNKGELDKIQNLREKFTDITTTLGNIEMQILSFELEKEEIKEELKSMKLQEISLADELKNKYGDGNISLETGEFTPFEEKKYSPIS